MIYNLTQHVATPEQAVNVIEPANKAEIQELLTFETPPTIAEIQKRASALARQVPEGIMLAMIGGAPYLMSSLEKELTFRGIQPLYSFSERVSVEEKQNDGTVVKKSVFRHKNFVAV